MADKEHEARIEAEQDARHMMRAVLWIDAGVVLFVIVCAAAVLVILFR